MRRSNSQLRSGDSQLKWSTVRQSTQLVNSHLGAVNSAGQQSTHLWTGQLSSGLINSTLDDQLNFDQISSELSIVSATLNHQKLQETEMAPSVPRTHAAAALLMKQIALDNQSRMIRHLRAKLATKRRESAAIKKEHESTQVALEASHTTIAGLTEIALHAAAPSLLLRRRRRPRAAAAAADLCRKFVSGRFDEENPFVQNSSVLLVQPDEGVSVLVVDLIGDYRPQSTEKSRVLVIPVGARHKCQQDRKGPNFRHGHRPPPRAAVPIHVALMNARDLHAGRAWEASAARRGVRLTARERRPHMARRCVPVGRTLALSSAIVAPMLGRRCCLLRATVAPHGCWTSPMNAQALPIVARCWPGVVESCCAAACAVVRARDFVVGGAAVAGRRSGESPAMS
ncbi:zinc finger family protein [Dorcoceras hygrometricum]|uniref:Zinc finger family protein n=1 Tax=Dorcoceras hygrometricum TaxID=472368 RepID=A0A2Z7C9D0_9LAMI|nr:zinc finger family protein [Dorcoceras hygrometricum]